MPQQFSSVENNFTAGLKTEFTGLNFPENAATETDNCDYTTIGVVTRRGGVDFELNHDNHAILETDGAITSYRWENVGGDGVTKLLVTQVGSTLYFWNYSLATITNPISTQRLVGTVPLSQFMPAGGVSSTPFECQYAEGNGFLFVFNPALEPFYCAYDASIGLTATPIIVQIRDFLGVPEPGVGVNTRPTVLTAMHSYNLLNQGWNSAPTWLANSTTTEFPTTGSKVFTIAAGLPITGGQPIQAADGTRVPLAGCILTGTVTSYVGTSLTVNITNVVSSGGSFFNAWTIYPLNAGLLGTWNGSQGNYPSNADVWWRFKNTSEVFDPATTAPNITLNAGNAAKGHFILDAFYQARTAVSGQTNISEIVTTARPRTGTWFQGRVWYAGVDASVSAIGTAPTYTWTESIYFSQVIVDQTQFGYCYQNNDPTAEDFFDLLPTDGGVIQIQGCGKIYKLFPVQNGLLVFASNGIWFITGSQGIGFSANDYTVTKISSVRALSGSSFVNVQGYPLFWNEEGIYSVAPAEQGNSLMVNNLTHSTIGTFYAAIPLQSKIYAKGDFDPLNFRVSWLYKSNLEASITDRYRYNQQLNLNTETKAFFPYTFFSTNYSLNDIRFIYGISGSDAIEPSFKYLTTFNGTTNMSFSEMSDYTNWTDFFSETPTAYVSYFVTGYKLHGKALVKWQPLYVNFFSKADRATAYKIHGIWDYANNPNSGKYTTIQTVTNALSRFGMIYRKHKIRGRGMSLQLKVGSVAGMPFDIMGWSSMETLDTGM